MSELRTIIVEDEATSREILRNYLTKYCPSAQVLGEASNITEGLELIKKNNPDLVFLDVEMPFGNAFDLLDKVPDRTFETVFVTAFDNYAIKAINLSAAYYLLKPIDIDELVACVDKLIEQLQNKEQPLHASLLLENLRQQNGPQKIMLPTLEGFEIVKLADIVYCEADDNFTKFHFIDKTALLICRTLKYFEDTLPTNQFIRIHRSHMINLEYVIRYTKGKGGFVTLENQKELEVAPKKKRLFLEAFMR